MNNRLLLFMIGITFGGIVSVLFAPTPGRRTRRLLARKVDRGKALIERQSAAVLDSAAELFDGGKRSIERASGAMSTTVEAWKGVVHAG